MTGLGTSMSACMDALRRLDPYIDNQLDVAGMTLLTRHLDSCPSCTQELEVRRRLRNRLRSAVSKQEVSPYLGTRVMANLRATGKSSSWIHRTGWLGAAAAAIVVAVALGSAYRLGNLRYTAESQDAYIESLIHKVAHVVRPGIQNHVHCSVFRKYPKNPPAVAELSEKIGPEYKPLVDVMKDKAPAGFRMVLAHQCSYKGRKFVHVTIKRDGQVASLVLTDRRAGESYRDSGMVPFLNNGGLQLFGATAGRFQIDGFESRDHLAYVVSDMPSDRNRQLLLAVANDVHALLTKLES